MTAFVLGLIILIAFMSLVSLVLQMINRRLERKIKEREQWLREARLMAQTQLRARGLTPDEAERIVSLKENMR